MEEIRVHRLQVGDVVSSSSPDMFYPKSIGQHLTYYPKLKKYFPAIITPIGDRMSEAYGDIVIREVIKSRKKWWQFWRSNKIKTVIFEVIKV